MFLSLYRLISLCRTIHSQLSSFARCMLCVVVCRPSCSSALIITWKRQIRPPRNFVWISYEYVGLKLVGSFNRIRQVAPTAQERASHPGLCHAFLVSKVFCATCSVQNKGVWGSGGTDPAKYEGPMESCNMQGPWVSPIKLHHC